jgi:uncharacterized membrane protein YhhN
MEHTVAGSASDSGGALAEGPAETLMWSSTGPDDTHPAITPEQAWAVVAALWTAYLILLVLGVEDPALVAAKSLLMPSLAFWSLIALGPEAPRLLLAGLALATIGDIGVNFDPPVFLAGMAGFLGMQASYSAGFLRMGAWPVVRRNWALPAAYFAFWAAVNIVVIPRLGDVRIPAMIYSFALVTMAALAGGIDRRVAIGGLTFLVSDLLLALRIADLDFRHNKLVVMMTYLASQYLITTGWARRVDPDVLVPV